VSRDPKASAANFARLIAMLDGGKINPPIHGVYDLTDFETALGLLTSRQAQGKVLLRVGG
jgi:NADPH2:quinone reductase